MKPLVSVIVPTYNRPHFLREALRSVIAQDFSDWECIVVDDGSSDSTADTILELSRQDARIRGLRVENGRFPGRTRNFGIAEAQGSLLAFLDDDDVWLSHKLGLQIALLEARADAVMTFSRVERFGSERGPWPGKPPPRELSLAKLLKANVIPCSTVVARAAFVRQAGGFNEGRLIAEDYELWLRLRRLGPFVGHPAPLTRYRVHESGITKTSAAELDCLEALYRELQAQWQLPARLLRPARRTLARRRMRRQPWLTQLGQLPRLLWPLDTPSSTR